MYPRLSKLTEWMKKDVAAQIESNEYKIKELMREAELLHVLYNSDLSHQPYDKPVDSYFDAINDLADREAILQFFYEKLGRDESIMAKFLFQDAAHFPYMCKLNDLECPQWFIEKYDKQNIMAK